MYIYIIAIIVIKNLCLFYEAAVPELLKFMQESSFKRAPQ
jgi:hypothetical protein